MANDSMDSVVKAVALRAAFAAVHAGEGVLDASVFGIVLFLAAQEGASGSSAVRDDQTGAQVGAAGAGSNSSSGRRYWMTRQTVAGEIPKSWAS